MVNERRLHFEGGQKISGSNQRKTSRKVFSFLLLAAVAFGTGPTHAKPPENKSHPAETCRDAAQYAANLTGVPVAVLRAISLTETGRMINGAFSPWPWTVNVGGQGKWFPNRKTAQKFARQVFGQGKRSFDVGCFQLNFKWHGKNFTSINQMFDPHRNAVYAAKYLRALYQKKGDWVAAAGAYHSTTPIYATKYSHRFSRIWAGVTKVMAGGSPPIRSGAGVKNSKIRYAYPFFSETRGAQGTHGSLVALSETAPLHRLVVPVGGPLF